MRRLNRSACGRLFAGFVLGAAACSGIAGVSDGADESVAFYGLRSPDNEHDIEQASGLQYGRLGDREGLWTVCDRNGGRSAGRLFFISSATLGRATHREAVIADDAFTLVLPDEDWTTFANRRRSVGADILASLRQRIEASKSPNGKLPLDLEAVTIAPSPQPPHEPRVFVVAEEPFSLVLELSLEGGSTHGRARLRDVYRYVEADDEHGADHNDGLEGFAYAGVPGRFFWAEEGTKFHDGPPGPRLFFLNPKIGAATLMPGQVKPDGPTSDALTAAVHARRTGRMQTLNALTVDPQGRILAVDRNGGWILRIDPKMRTAEPWLNLYDHNGMKLREALADFPGPRRMPYISIEGIAVDPTGTLWLVDDPAMPETFRASCLVRIPRPPDENRPPPTE